MVVSSIKLPYSSETLDFPLCKKFYRKINVSVPSFCLEKKKFEIQNSKASITCRLRCKTFVWKLLRNKTKYIRKNSISKYILFAGQLKALQCRPSLIHPILYKVESRQLIEMISIV